MDQNNENSELWRDLNPLCPEEIVNVPRKHTGLFSPSSLLIESLVEYICVLTEKDKPSQKQLYITICEKLHELQLIDDSFSNSDFDFIRNHYEKELYRLITVAKSVLPVIQQYNVAVPVLPQENTWRQRNKLFQWSRYSNEYRELEFIAKGGFGEVVKVQNKLDAGIYAIKKICLKYCSIYGFLRGLSEVQMLAKLNHPNIVSYKAAWLEPLLKIQKTECSKLVLCSEENSDSNRENDSTEVLFTQSNQSKCNGNSDKDVVLSKDDQVEDPINCRNSFGGNNFNKNDLAYETFHSINKNRKVIHKCDQEWAVLFIQMKLCHETLRQWLDKRNSLCNTPIDIEESLNVFLQIVRGVKFIHSKGIVHHDIKPNNIFISKDGKEVQVGDFGLSCCLLHDVCPDASAATIIAWPNCPVSVTHQPGEIGTKLYASPEQLSGVCNFKSDMFSLGILLFELIYSFHTNMERIEKINNLRRGIFPSDLQTIFPSIVKIIKKLVNENLDKRPSAVELLNDVSKALHEYCHPDENVKNIVKRLEEELCDKNEEINELKKQILSLQKTN